jgi:DNA modification methylase
MKLARTKRAKPGGKAGECVLLKADARHLPLRASSVELVIATPPHFGVQRCPESFCTRDRQHYQGLLDDLSRECLRVLQPGGHLIIYLHQGRSRISKVFDVCQKRRRGRKWRLQRLRPQVLRFPYLLVPGFWWYALPVSIYRKLIMRYSSPRASIAHVFSGSGNGGIAAVQLKRQAFLVDLHYHRVSASRIARHAPR